MAINETESEKDPEFREKLNLALESVGSEDIARDLVNDKIKDAFLLKFKIKIETKIVILMVLVSTFSKKILFVYSLGGNAKSLNKVKPFENYIRFMHEFIQISSESGIDPALSLLVGRAAYNALNESVLDRQIQFWEEKKIDQTVKFISDKIAELTKLNLIQIESDMEKLSSVLVRHKSILQDVVKPIVPPSQNEEVIDPTEGEDYKQFLSQMSPKFDLVLRVKTLLAPNDGKLISHLTEEDTICCKALANSQEQKKAAGLLKLITKEGKIKTIEGKVMKVFVDAEGQYHTFASGPDNTLLYAIDGQELKIQIKDHTVAEPESIAEEGMEKGESKPIDITYFIGFILVVISISIAYFIFLA